MEHHIIGFEVNLVDRPGYSALLLDYTLQINGIEFHPAQIDLTSLVKSCQWSGELDIFTCSCGSPGCAGIFQGIEVEHAHDAITWRCLKPLSVNGDLQEIWAHGAATLEHFTFSPDQYIDAIDSGIKRIKSLAVSAMRPVEFPVLGVELEQVLTLQTRPFSTHTMEPERRILARQVVVDAYYGFVLLDGVEYQMGELNVDAEIMEEYLAWKAICVFPNSEAEIPAYLAYLQSGRSFCRAWRQKIGRKTSMKFKYHPPTIYNKDAWEIIEVIR